jgi:hypothetical protein
MILLKTLLKKAVSLIIVGVIAGWIYTWASPHLFPRNKEMGFWFGVAHGALMPIALPSLLMGQDVEIFATPNSGRPYKIGYIGGINLCGLLFFGTAFWKPLKPHAKDATDATQLDQREKP